MMTSQIAAKHGAIATHMPKPFSDLTGNGSHMHLSLWKDDRDRRSRRARRATRAGSASRKLAYQFLGGLAGPRPRHWRP